MKGEKALKIPTAEVFAAYRGAHWHQLWARVGPDWICPSCKRSKFQILRWTMRFPRTADRFEDWMAGCMNIMTMLAVGMALALLGFNQWSSAISAMPRTVQRSGD